MSLDGASPPVAGDAEPLVADALPVVDELQRRLAGQISRARPVEELEDDTVHALLTDGNYDRIARRYGPERARAMIERLVLDGLAISTTTVSYSSDPDRVQRAYRYMATREGKQWIDRYGRTHEEECGEDGEKRHHRLREALSGVLEPDRSVSELSDEDLLFALKPRPSGMKWFNDLASHVGRERAGEIVDRLVADGLVSVSSSVRVVHRADGDETHTEFDYRNTPDGHRLLREIKERRRAERAAERQSALAVQRQTAARAIKGLDFAASSTLLAIVGEHGTITGYVNQAAISKAADIPAPIVSKAIKTLVDGGLVVKRSVRDYWGYHEGTEYVLTPSGESIIDRLRKRAAKDGVPLSNLV